MLAISSWRMKWLRDGPAFFEIFERLSTFVFPSRKTICAAAINNCGGCAWTAELYVLGEDIKAALLYKGAVLNKLLA